MKYDNVVCWIRDFEKAEVVEFFEDVTPYFATDFKDFKNHITETAYLIISYPFVSEWKRILSLKSILNGNQINLLQMRDEDSPFMFSLDCLAIFDEGITLPGSWHSKFLYDHYKGIITPNCHKHFYPNGIDDWEKQITEDYQRAVEEWEKENGRKWDQSTATS